ncbi:MAG: hypothetical protein AB7P20_25250 [Rhizobiaceae bacterium]
MKDVDLTTAKAAGDVVSFGVVVGTLLDILSAIAALLTIVWTAIRVYETATVQRLLVTSCFNNITTLSLTMILETRFGRIRVSI